MQITRRDFVKYLSATAAAFGLGAADLARLSKALAAANAPKVIWLEGSSCSGCTVSFLNRISSTQPYSADDVLLNFINLAYHPTLMAAAGQPAAEAARRAYDAGGYVLVVEGGVPTAFGGVTCQAWNYNGVDVPFKDALTDMASRAAAIVCVGTCASFGGVAAAPPNPTGVKGVGAYLGKPTINLPGCPTHPDWIVWAVVQLLMGTTVTKDTYSRPTALYGSTVHSICPRRSAGDTSSYGLDGRCLEELGCRGPSTRANCPTTLWNGKTNWCIGANAPCIGCTNPDFPASRLLVPGD